MQNKQKHLKVRCYLNVKFFPQESKAFGKISLIKFVTYDTLLLQTFGISIVVDGRGSDIREACDTFDFTFSESLSLSTSSFSNPNCNNKIRWKY